MLKDKFIAVVKKYPNRMAIKTETVALTYDMLYQQSRDLANRLIDQISILKSCVTCGLLFSHGHEGVVAVMACVLAGIPYVPLDLNYPLPRLTYMVEASKVRLLLTDEAGKNTGSDILTHLDQNIEMLLWNDTMTLGDFLKENPYKHSIVYQLYTSGSTGKPKAIEQTGEAIDHFTSQYANLLKITCEDRITLFSTYGHDAAVMDIFTTLLVGACLYPLDLHNPINLLKLKQWLLHHNITIWHSVPSVYRSFWKSVRGGETFPELRLMVLGGESVREDDYNLLASRLPKSQLYNLYGQTESSFTAGRFVIEESDVRILGEPIDRTTLLIYINDALLIVKEPGQKIRYEECCELKNCGLQNGELLIASPYIVRGYINNTSSTNNNFISTSTFGRVYRTGDFTMLGEDDVIQMIGRQDRQVKIRGNRVELGEIESYILKIEAIEECIVELDHRGKIIAFIKSINKYTTLDLNQHLNQYLPSYMLIFEVKHLDRMPLTPTGKINRIELIKKMRIYRRNHDFDYLS